MLYEVGAAGAVVDVEHAPQRLSAVGRLVDAALVAGTGGLLLPRAAGAQDGGLVARQSIDKLIRRKAEEFGIDSANLGTHAGRRSVVTALYVAGEDLEDIARHVGHR